MYVLYVHVNKLKNEKTKDKLIINLDYVFSEQFLDVQHRFFNLIANLNSVSLNTTFKLIP